MGFRYHHLDEHDVRDAMLELWSGERRELRQAGLERSCYGKDLTDAGWEHFESAMPQALHSESDGWLADQMTNPDFWREMRPHKRHGEVNYNKAAALETLCFGEFNIAYVHGLARALLERGESECVVYRADDAYEPRGECSEWEGRRFSLETVIAGHRVRYWPPGEGDPEAFSVPSGVNCHHSIHAVGAA